jgi:hypothetical protein
VTLNHVELLQLSRMRLTFVSKDMDEEPIFVGGSGRRRFVLRWSGITAAILLAVLVVCVGLAMIFRVTVPPPMAHDDGSRSPQDGQTSEAAGR